MTKRHALAGKNVFDIATGQSTAQYIYQLESRITLNNRVVPQ